MLDINLFRTGMKQHDIPPSPPWAPMHATLTPAVHRSQRRVGTPSSCVNHRGVDTRTSASWTRSWSSMGSGGTVCCSRS